MITTTMEKITIEGYVQRGRGEGEVVERNSTKKRRPLFLNMSMNGR